MPSRHILFIFDICTTVYIFIITVIIPIQVIIQQRAISLEIIKQFSFHFLIITCIVLFYLFIRLLMVSDDLKSEKVEKEHNNT